MRGTRGPMKKLLFAMAIGAALAWLFDPDAGARRRDPSSASSTRRASPGRARRSRRDRTDVHDAAPLTSVP